MRGLRVAIIGGGVGAVDLAYPLRQHGIPVDIFEQQADLAMLSARRSAGQLSYDDGGPPTDASKAVLSHWEKESGFPPFLIECPTAHLMLKGGPDDSYRHVLRGGMRPGLTKLSAVEAAGLWGPGNLRASRIERAVLDERDYRLNPMSMVELLRQSNDIYGELHTDTQVVSIERDSDGAWRLDAKFLGTAHRGYHRERPIARDARYTHVINAAGAYANEIAVLADQVAPGVRPTMGTSFRAELPARRSINAAGPMLVWDTDDLGGCYIMPSESTHMFGSPSDKQYCHPQPPTPDPRALNTQLASIAELTGIGVGAYQGMTVVGCMRTYGPGDKPVLGVDDDGWGNLNGLGSHGVQLGPAIGEYLASRITGVAPPPAIAAALEEHLPWLESCSPEAQRLPGPELTHPHGYFRYPSAEERFGAGVTVGSEEHYLRPLTRSGIIETTIEKGYEFSPSTGTWVAERFAPTFRNTPPLPERRPSRTPRSRHSAR